MRGKFHLVLIRYIIAVDSVALELDTCPVLLPRKSSFSFDSWLQGKDSGESEKGTKAYAHVLLPPPAASTCRKD